MRHDKGNCRTDMESKLLLFSSTMTWDACKLNELQMTALVVVQIDGKARCEETDVWSIM